MSIPKKPVLAISSKHRAIPSYKNKYANYDSVLASSHIGEIQKFWKKQYKSINEQVFLHEGKLYVNDQYNISTSQNKNNPNQGPKITNPEQSYELIQKDVYITQNQLMISYPEIKKNDKTLIYYINLQFNYIVQKCQSLHHENQKYFGFSIKKKDQSFNFYQTDKNAIKNWVKLLLRYSIQNIMVFDQQYKIVNKLGKGISSCVYKVEFNKEQMSEQQQQEKKMIPCFAAKICYKHKLEKNVLDMIINGIKNEICILQSCNGENNIISLYQVYEGKKQIVQILELAKFGDLFQLLKDQQCLSEMCIHEIFVQLNQALLLLNQKNIVHRDIKLTNVLLKKMCKCEPVIRLADFGLAIVYVEGKSERMTQSCGTLGFMAPEIFTSKTGYDQQVDIFATGVMLYTMYNGTLPFKGSNKQEIVNNTINKNLDFKRPQWTHASEHFIDLLKKMTMKNPMDRITIQQIQLHPWMKEFSNKKEALSKCILYDSKQYKFDDDMEFPTKTFGFDNMKQNLLPQTQDNKGNTSDKQAISSSPKFCNNLNRHHTAGASASNNRSESLNHSQLDANQKQHLHEKNVKSVAHSISNGNLLINNNNQKTPTYQMQNQPQKQSSFQQKKQNNHPNIKIQIDNISCSSQDNSFNEQFFQKLQLDNNLQSPSNVLMSADSIKSDHVFLNQQLNSPQNIKDSLHNVISSAMKLQSKQKQIQQQNIGDKNNQYGNTKESDYNAILMDENYQAQVCQKIAKYQINVQIKNNFANGGNSSALKIDKILKQQTIPKNSSF